MNKKIPIIVEFNGLPGLGKTTVANILIKELTQLGYKTIRNYRHNIFHTLRHPFPELYDLKLFKLVSSYSKQILPTTHKRTHVHWTNFYVQKYESIIKCSDADFVIVDEGIIQFFEAMAYQDIMPKSDLVDAIIKRIMSKGVSFIRVDCKNNIDEAANRIMTRPQRGLAFERMQYDELRNTLENWALNFDYLRLAFSNVYGNQEVVEIDTNKNPIQNANIIKNYLLRR